MMMNTHSLDLTDEEVTARVQKGDANIFGVLIERYEEKLLRYARKFYFSTEDAKDLVQNVFIKTYMNIKGFNIQKRFSPWIYRIAHNEFINELKKKKHYESVPLFDFDVFFPHLATKETADKAFKESETKKIVEDSLKTLPIKYREPLTLFYFEDMDYEAIADILQIPVSTVGVRLKRGRDMLKKRLIPFQ